MDNIISISNLSFNFKDREVFKNLNLEIKKGRFTTIVGSSGSGKSTLIKLITGKLGLDENVVIDKLSLNQSNLNNIQNIIVAGFQLLNSDAHLETTLDEILLFKPNIDKKNTIDEIIRYSKLLGIEEQLKQKSQTLNDEEKQLMFLITLFILKPAIIALDKDNCRLTKKKYNNVMQILKKLQEEYNITIIQATNEIEDTLYGEDIVIMNQGQIVIQGNIQMVLEKKEIFDKLNLERPFSVNLSEKLKFYGIIDKNYLNLEKLVDAVWK